jgi:hypothetical protein
VDREDAYRRELEALGMFHHPVPGRSRRRVAFGPGSGRNRAAGPSLTVAMGLLVLIVAGAFWLAPAPPVILFSALDRPEHPVDRLPPGTPMTLTVDLRQDGFPGLFAIGPDGYLRWLYPPDGGSEAFLPARAGRRTYFETLGFRPSQPGAWLFVHFLDGKPVTPAVQQTVVQELRSGRLWHSSPFALAPEVERILSSSFREVIAQPFTVSP